MEVGYNCAIVRFVFSAIKSSPIKPDFLKTLEKKTFENIVGKGENAVNQHFLLFPQCFLPVPKTNFNFSDTYILSSANAFNLDQSKNALFGKESKAETLTLFYHGYSRLRFGEKIKFCSRVVFAYVWQRA